MKIPEPRKTSCTRVLTSSEDQQKAKKKEKQLKRKTEDGKKGKNWQKETNRKIKRILVLLKESFLGHNSWQYKYYREAER